jgi:hypothetical protein
MPNAPFVNRGVVVVVVVVVDAFSPYRLYFPFRPVSLKPPSPALPADKRAYRPHAGGGPTTIHRYRCPENRAPLSLYFFPLKPSPALVLHYPTDKRAYPIALTRADTIHRYRCPENRAPFLVSSAIRTYVTQSRAYWWSIYRPGRQPCFTTNIPMARWRRLYTPPCWSSAQ